MLMNRNGDAEKCWKQYKRIIKLLTVSWQKATNSWRKMVPPKVSPFAVIRGHSVWQQCNSTDEQSSPKSPIRMKLRTEPLQTAVPSACTHCIWCLCLRAVVYSPTAQWMQSAHVDLLWHVYSRANMTFVGTMKAHHMRLKQNLPSGSSCFNEIILQNTLMTYLSLLYAVGAKLTSSCHIWTSFFLAVCNIAGGK